MTVPDAATLAVGLDEAHLQAAAHLAKPDEHAGVVASYIRSAFSPPAVPLLRHQAASASPSAGQPGPGVPPGGEGEGQGSARCRDQRQRTAGLSGEAKFQPIPGVDWAFVAHEPGVLVDVLGDDRAEIGRRDMRNMEAPDPAATLDQRHDRVHMRRAAPDFRPRRFPPQDLPAPGGRQRPAVPAGYRRKGTACASAASRAKLDRDVAHPSRTRLRPCVAAMSLLRAHAPALTAA